MQCRSGHPRRVRIGAVQNRLCAPCSAQKKMSAGLPVRILEAHERITHPTKSTEHRRRLPSEALQEGRPMRDLRNGWELGDALWICTRCGRELGSAWRDRVLFIPKATSDTVPRSTEQLCVRCQCTKVVRTSHAPTSPARAYARRPIGAEQPTHTIHPPQHCARSGWSLHPRFLLLARPSTAEGGRRGIAMPAGVVCRLNE